MNEALETYRRAYGRVPDISGSNGFALLLGQNARMHAEPLVRRKPTTIIAGPWRGSDKESYDVVKSFDLPMLRFQLSLTEDFARAFQVKLNSNQFSTNGVHVSPDAMRSVAGYMMTPMSYVPVDNALYRAELGLSPGYGDVERAIAEEFWDLVFSEADASDLNLPVLSTSGVYRFNYDAKWKADYAGMVMDPQNFEAILNMVEKKKWTELFNEYEMVFMLYMQTRQQTESPSKKRRTLSLEYSLSGGRRDQAERFADKRVRIDGMEYPDLGATRARNVQAGPWTVNCLLQITASTTVKSMFRRWPDVFHVTTPEQIEALIDGHYVVCGDVTEYDRSMSRDAIEVPLRSAAKKWDPRLVEMARRLLYAPYYSRPLELDGVRGEWVGDPRDPAKYEVLCGNRSGHAWTSLLAKGNKVVDDLIRFHHLGHTVKGRVADWLAGKQIIKIINNGDDMVNYSLSRAAVESVRKAFEDPRKGHYLVKEEVGQVYSGYMILQKQEGVPKYEVVSRLYTQFEKWIVPERSAGSKHRQFWPVGIMERINRLDKTHENPASDEAWEILFSNWRRHMTPHYGDLENLVSTALESLPLHVEDLTSIDREVLESPEKIHYKYLPEELSKEVRDKLSSKIPYLQFRHILKGYYNGKVFEEEYLSRRGVDPVEG